MKYIKPKSITWWSGVIPLLCGLLVATEPLHGLAPIVTSIDNVTGGVSPAVMINGGLAAIGLRAAL